MTSDGVAIRWNRAIPAGWQGRSRSARWALQPCTPLLLSQPPFAAWSAGTGEAGPDAAALLVASIAVSDVTNTLDAQRANAAVTAVASLLIPPEHCYGHGDLPTCCNQFPCAART